MLLSPCRCRPSPFSSLWRRHSCTPRRWRGGLAVLLLSWGLAHTPALAEPPARERWSPTQSTAQPDENVRQKLATDRTAEGDANKGAPPVVTFFDDAATFEGTVGGPLSHESFNQGNVAAGEVAVCSDPFDTATDDNCWNPGDIAARLQVASSGGNGVAILGPGVVGNDSIVTGADTFTDDTWLSFSEGGVFALGLDLASNADEILQLELFDDKGTLLASSSLDATLEPRFWGVLSEQPFSRLAVVSDNGELLDNVRFGPPPPRLEARLQSEDLCRRPSSNVNGIWEPGEGVRLSLTLSAVGGDFHNVAAIFSSPDEGLSSPLPQVGFGDLLNGESRSRPITLQLAPNVPCFSTLQLALEALSTEGSFRFDRLQEVGRLPLPGDLPLDVPDDTPSGVESSLEVVTAGPLTDLRVQVEIEHSWVGDLEILLTSPAGTTVTLLDRPGVPDHTFGCSRDNMDVLFSDDADEPLEDVCLSNPWFVGTAQPQEALAAFVGEELAGSWRLTVIDHAPGDGGRVVAWRLLSEPSLQGQCSPCEDSGTLISALDIPTLGRPAFWILAWVLASLAAHRLYRKA